MKTSQPGLPVAIVVQQMSFRPALAVFKKIAAFLLITSAIIGTCYGLRAAVVFTMRAHGEYVQAQHEHFLSDCRAAWGYSWQRTYPNGYLDDPLETCFLRSGQALFSVKLDTALLH